MVACNVSLVELGDEAGITFRHLVHFPWADHYTVKTEVPLFASVTFHHLGLALTAVFSLIATIIACILIFLHATHYSIPHQQRHIIRILFMVAVSGGIAASPPAAAP